MKNLLLSILIILFAITVKAQDTGIPKELTCTERAFNFSFSVGTRWKFTAPKMGPVEAPSSETLYNPARGMKINPTTYETDSQKAIWAISSTCKTMLPSFIPTNLGLVLYRGIYFPLSNSVSLSKVGLWPNIPVVSDRIISNTPNLTRE